MIESSLKNKLINLDNNLNLHILSQSVLSQDSHMRNDTTTSVTESNGTLNVHTISGRRQI